MLEPCKCGHSRHEHADHVNPLQVTPLHVTDSDENRDDPRIPGVVYGAGECTVEGCGCKKFTPGQDLLA